MLSVIGSLYLAFVLAATLADMLAPAIVKYTIDSAPNNSLFVTIELMFGHLARSSASLLISSGLIPITTFLP